ncbi:methyltransferase [Agromyces luteolus]|uniref:Methyltransferase domain-containing protein n=1 Tax=Agromyces luteolus TaxID=88373 RepID=A0A7C9HK00_9MICO|nr:class I SAM-dependent methyltransferase [Agromyces luteolus]MUN08988.1 methyltransferase domain-containing protein [Agromyces luteolus]GLK28676.1 methyltransferase [Agromyces luteolus]
MVEADVWQDGKPYERYVGRWSRLVAAKFVDVLDAAPGIRWLDVGCGTGALTSAVIERWAPSSIVGIDPSEGFLATARERPDIAGRDEARFLVGDAEHLPIPDDSADAIVSGLLLNFLPDAAAAVAEFTRVAAPGALVAAYVWDYAGEMQMLRTFWDVAVALDPEAAELDEGRRFALCRPEPLRQLWSRAPGMDVATVRIKSIEIGMTFADFDDLWDPFLGGQGPAPTYLQSMTDGSRAAIRDRMREETSFGCRPDGSIMLRARAWVVVGRLG